MPSTYALSPAACLFHADARDALKALPADSLDSCVTDPPYALVSTVKRFANSPRTEASMPTAGPYERASRGFMGQRWDTGECAFSAEFWSEVYRVLKPGAFLAAFGATRGYHRMACAIEDAGFEIRDSLMWVYGSGFPKSQNVAKFIDKEMGEAGEYKSAQHAGTAARGERTQTGIAIHDRPWMSDPEALERQAREYLPASAAAKEFDGFGTALKPAFEPIVLARKPLSEGTVAANVLKWRTGAINIDGCRVATAENLNGGTYSKGNKHAHSEGWGMANASGREFAQPEGRWPANVITDGSDEVVGCFPVTAAAKAGKRNAPKTGGTFGDYAGDEPERLGHSDAGGSADRFFYSAKASKADRNGSKHPTVKPIALMQWLARLITPPGGTILDPFAGSGTTGAAAALEGFNCVMVEREAEYVADIVRRLQI